MKTIGILGGLGPESTAAYYTYITRKYFELHSDYNYPEILIHSLTFTPFIKAGYRLPERVISAIEGLAQTGADFVVAACNSLHVVYDEVASQVSIPWVSIMSATGEAIHKAGLKKVALLGTVFTMENDFYSRRLDEFGITTVVPNHEERSEINRIIYDELIIGNIAEHSRRYVLNVISRLAVEGVEGVILGCTELPFLIQQKHTCVPVFDTTIIHAHKALELVLIQ